MKVLSFLLTIFMAFASLAEERKALGEKEKKEVIQALEVNEGLHQAFFDYDAKKVEKKAQELKEAIKKISHKEIAKRLDFSSKKLDELKASNDRDVNNQNYHLISMALIHIVKSYDLGSTYQAYSCPMAKKQWIQNAKKVAKVQNPYMADMPSCGGKDSHF